MKIRVFILALLLLVTGCTDAALQIQAQAANSVAQTANAALPILLERYRQEGLRAIDVVKDAGGTADEARAAVDAVKAKWAPVWKAWETLRVAQGAWADTIAGGADAGSTLEALRDAYCGLIQVWPKDIVAVPLGPLKCPEIK